MKRIAIALLVLIFFSVSSVFGQRTKNENFDFKYVQVPLIGLPDQIKTYQVIINPGSNQLLGNVDFTFIRYIKQSAWYSVGSSSNYGSLALAQQEFLNLFGYERAADADLIIEAWFEPLIIKSKKLVYHEYCHSISKPCYAYDLTFNYGAGFRVSTKEGQTLIDTVFFDPKKDHRGWFGVGTSGMGADIVAFFENNDMTFAYPSSAELEQRFQNSLEYNKAELTRAQLLKMEEIINDRYGYPVKEYKTSLTTGRSRKNRNYDDLDKAIDLMKDGVAKFNEQADSIQWLPMFREAVAIWEEAFKEADPDGKDARIYNDLAHGLLFNIGITSIWLGEWDVVDNLAPRAKDLSQDRKYAERLVNFKNQRKSRIENYKAVKSND
jgi:hypothetical protein